MAEFTELFQLMLIAIGLFPSINKGIQILFGSSRCRKQQGGIGPPISRKESRTKQLTVEQTPDPVEAGENNVVQLYNSPKSKHRPPKNSSQALNGFKCGYDTDVNTEKRVEFNGNNAGGRKRKVEAQNKTALAMNSWSSSQNCKVTKTTYIKYRMSHERHCSRKHGSTRENKPTTTTSLIIKKSNRVVFKGSLKTYNKRIRKC